MSERASQTAQRYVDAMNIASAKIEQLQAEVEALRAQVARVREAVAYAERNYDAPIVTIGAIKIALDGGDA